MVQGERIFPRRSCALARARARARYIDDLHLHTCLYAYTLCPWVLKKRKKKLVAAEAGQDDGNVLADCPLSNFCFFPFFPSGFTAQGAVQVLFYAFVTYE